jgi:hypothetical protein
MTLQLNLLGGFDCRSGTADVLTFPTSKVRAMRRQARGGPTCARRSRACAKACRGMRGIALPSTGASWPSGRAAWKWMWDCS